MQTGFRSHLRPRGSGSVGPIIALVNTLTTASRRLHQQRQGIRKAPSGAGALDEAFEEAPHEHRRIRRLVLVDAASLFAVRPISPVRYPRGIVQRSFVWPRLQ